MCEDVRGCERMLEERFGSGRVSTVGRSDGSGAGRELIRRVAEGQLLEGLPEAWREPLASWRGALSELANLYCLYAFAEFGNLYYTAGNDDANWRGERSPILAVRAATPRDPRSHPRRPFANATSQSRSEWGAGWRA